MATYEDFDKVELRVGKIIEAHDFAQAKKPAYKLLIDFGDEIGVKRSSAQLPQNYLKADLINKYVIGIVNFPPRQIGPVKSEVLVLGVPDKNGNCILLSPDKTVPLGGRVF